MARRPSACPLLPYTTLFRSMILHVHGEVLLARLERHALGHGPTDQGAVLLEAEIVVKPSRVMALNDEDRSEEHTSELQSRLHLVCRLLLEKKIREYELARLE